MNASNMNMNISKSAKSLQRTHNFINRTPQTALNITKKNNWHEVIKAIMFFGFGKDHTTNTNTNNNNNNNNNNNKEEQMTLTQGGLNIRCLKI